jgi:hypothetical protein
MNKASTTQVASNRSLRFTGPKYQGPGSITQDAEAEPFSLIDPRDYEAIVLLIVPAPEVRFWTVECVPVRPCP